MEASRPNGGAPSLDLSPDFAATPGRIDRSAAVALVGFLGAGSSDQYLRLYESVALNRWIEIRVVDIVGLERQADGGTHVSSTDEVGRIKVVKTESKGKGSKRIRIEVIDAS